MPVIVPQGGHGFTEVVVTGTFTDEEGQPAAGTLTFTLTQPMASNDVTVPPKPVVVTLDEQGRFSVTLFANDDEETVPAGVRYGVTEEIVGAQPRDYFILVSHALSPVDISTLMPGGTAWV